MLDCQPGDGTNIPAHVTVRLRYASEHLERTQKSRPIFSMARMSLEGDSELNAVGQNAQGIVFVAMAVDGKKCKSRNLMSTRWPKMAVTFHTTAVAPAPWPAASKCGEF